MISSPLPDGCAEANYAALRRKSETMDVKMMALIPARGNSKGLPGKNIISLNEKPLLAYSVESALDVGVFDHIIVSTDSDEIAKVAKGCGAETPFIRPSQLAEDQSLIHDVENHAVEQMAERGFAADIIVSLYPTSPFRRRSMMVRLLLKLLEGYHLVHIGISVSCDPSMTYYEKEAGVVVHSDSGAGLSPSHGIYGLGLFAGRWVSDRFPTWGSYVEETDEPKHLVDIDTMADLENADRMIRDSSFNVKD